LPAVQDPAAAPPWRSRSLPDTAGRASTPERVISVSPDSRLTSRWRRIPSAATRRSWRAHPRYRADGQPSADRTSWSPGRSLPAPSAPRWERPRRCREPCRTGASADRGGLPRRPSVSRTYSIWSLKWRDSHRAVWSTLGWSDAHTAAVRCWPRLS